MKVELTYKPDFTGWVLRLEKDGHKFDVLVDKADLYSLRDVITGGLDR